MVCCGLTQGNIMGRSFWFECSRCGYRATVAGRADRGRDYFVQTVSCRQCKQLYDAVIRLRVPLPALMPLGIRADGMARLAPKFRIPTVPPPFKEVMSRLPIRGASRFRWVRFKLQCPVSPDHRVQAWNDPGQCPRCGLPLDKNVLPYRVWE
jgi:hypothetical protein